MTDRASSDTTQPERPLTRAERREQTRALLIDAARMVFAEEGYHGANLERIAHVAGFSKGAVYSNFDGKAQLFLAVMDANLALLEGYTWDLFEDQSDGEEGASAEAPAASGEMTGSEQTAAMSGFALASLEFIAAAARDPELAPELAARGQLMVEAFTRVAEVSRDPDDPLSADELGALLSAFDQGMALLSLTGAGTIDTRHARLGLQRLAAPARAAAHGLAGSGPGTRAIHDRALQRRIMDDQG